MWCENVTSTSTDRAKTLETFGIGAMGKSGTLLKLEVARARSVVAFSAFPVENELVLMANSCFKVLLALPMAKVMLLHDMAPLPPNVDLIVMKEEE